MGAYDHNCIQCVFEVDMVSKEFGEILICQILWSL